MEEKELSVENLGTTWYSVRELDEIADQILRADAKTINPETGKERGIGGENPILFQEHIHARWRREIQTEGGVPDPHLSLDTSKPGRKTNNQPGMYNRTHPRGRKVNSEEQRRKHGASYYR